MILRSVGLEPGKLSHPVKMHFVARLAPDGALHWNTFLGGTGVDSPSAGYQLPEGIAYKEFTDR